MVITSADAYNHVMSKKTSQNFLCKNEFDMFSRFVMSKKRTFVHFLASSKDKLFFVKKEDMYSKRRTYDKPTTTGRDGHDKPFCTKAIII